MNAPTNPAPRYGAHTVVDALVESGVDVFFANPGTSEIHLVAAIDSNAAARAVLCLFEGVATGAGDGYARATGKPAAVLLHLGPGLANGLANLHNAAKARSPMVVLVGEHAAGHLRHESPLRSDLDALAGYAAKQVFHMAPGDDLRATLHAAVAACRALPAGPVVVVANADVMWALAGPVSGQAVPPSLAPAAPVPTPPATVAEAVAALRHGATAALVLGGAAMGAEATALADRIAQATGCAVLCETFNARHERGAGVVPVERIPYFRELAVARLAGFNHVVLAGSRSPVAFFASPGEPSELVAPGTRLTRLEPEASPVDFLRELAAALDANGPPRVAARVVADRPTGLLVPKAIWAALNRCLPAGAIVSDEAGVTSAGSDEAMRGAEPHVWMNLTGGSIGQGLPAATGAAIARPDALVVALHGDGGAMYTVQTLWTQARERAHVVNVIFRNDRYAILDHEVRRHGLAPLGAKGGAMFDLSEPGIEWSRLADAFSMPQCAVRTAEAFEDELKNAIARPGPTLIEVRLPPPRAKAA